MQIEEMKEVLREEIESLKKLHDKLSDEGHILSIETKDSLRRVLSGKWLDRMNDEAAWFFNKGHFEDFETNRSYVSRVLDELS